MIGRALLLAMLALPAAAEPGVVDVTITGVRNDHGHVLVAVCDEATFLAPSCAYRGQALAQPGVVTIRVAAVPAGRYAVQAYHDENDNGRLDRSFLGLPEEGIGFSRDAPMRFGPPEFAAAAISVPADGVAIAFGLRYSD